MRLCEWYILLLYGYWFICMVMVVAQHLSLLPAFEIWIQSHVLVAHSDYSKIFLEQQMCFLNFLSYVGKYTLSRHFMCLWLVLWNMCLTDWFSIRSLCLWLKYIFLKQFGMFLEYLCIFVSRVPVRWILNHFFPKIKKCPFLMCWRAWSMLPWIDWISQTRGNKCI